MNNENKFKVGDKVRFVCVNPNLRLYPCDAKKLGQVGTVTVESRAPTVTMPDGYVIQGWGEANYESVQQQQPEFLIHGTGRVFASMDAADTYIKAYGCNGETFIITQVVKRVKVSKVTTTTLEEIPA